MQKLNFPNNLGYRLPEPESVRELQRNAGFSNAYAHYLLTQNGADLDLLDDYNGTHPSLVPSDTEETGPYLRTLYGLDTGETYYDLRDCYNPGDLLAPYFFPIGEDKGGSPFVEILHGRYQGHIASLDYDMYIGCGNPQELATQMEIENFGLLSLAEQTNALCDPKIGLAWFHASTIDEFLNDCIYYDNHLNCRVLDAPSVENIG